MDRAAWRATVHRVKKSRIRLTTNSAQRSLAGLHSQSSRFSGSRCDLRVCIPNAFPEASVPASLRSHFETHHERAQDLVFNLGLSAIPCWHRQEKQQMKTRRTASVLPETKLSMVTEILMGSFEGK